MMIHNELVQYPKSYVKHRRTQSSTNQDINENGIQSQQSFEQLSSYSHTSMYLSANETQSILYRMQQQQNTAVTIVEQINSIRPMNEYYTQFLFGRLHEKLDQKSYHTKSNVKQNDLFPIPEQNDYENLSTSCNIVHTSDQKGAGNQAKGRDKACIISSSSKYALLGPSLCRSQEDFSQTLLKKQTYFYPQRNFKALDIKQQRKKIGLKPQLIKHPTDVKQLKRPCLELYPSQQLYPSNFKKHRSYCQINVTTQSFLLDELSPVSKNPLYRSLQSNKSYVNSYVTKVSNYGEGEQDINRQIVKELDQKSQTKYISQVLGKGGHIKDLNLSFRKNNLSAKGTFGSMQKCLNSAQIQKDLINRIKIRSGKSKILVKDKNVI